MENISEIMLSEFADFRATLKIDIVHALRYITNGGEKIENQYVLYYYIFL